MTKENDRKWVAIEEALQSKRADLLAKCDFKMLEFIVLNSKQRIALDQFEEEEHNINIHMEEAQLHFNLSVNEAREKLLQEIIIPALKWEDQARAKLNLKKAKLILKMLKENKQI